MNSDEMTETTVDGAPLWRGQEVRVHAGAHDRGTGFVDDLINDGSIVWIVFGGAEPRRGAARLPRGRRGPVHRAPAHIDSLEQRLR